MIHTKRITKVSNPRRKRPEDVPLHDNMNNNAVFFKYINYDINKNANTFKELFNIPDEAHINSCFVDLILKVYEKKLRRTSMKIGERRKTMKRSV